MEMWVHSAPTSRARPSLLAGGRGLATPEINADRVFTSRVAWACCRLWLLGPNREAAHAQQCGSKHRG
jgi:hypothetical protein